MIETPTLSDVINNRIENTLLGVHTALPGIVEKYNATDKTVNVKPMIKQKYVIDGEDKEVEFPVIPNVPVNFMQTNKAIISIPIKKNDIVLLIFMERSIDLWKTKESTVEPKDVRKFHLSDAIAIPGIRGIGKGMPADKDDLLIQHDKAVIKLSEDGTIEIGGNTVTKINLGLGTEPILKGNTAAAAFASHVHLGNLGVPSGPPIDGGTAFNLAKSSKVNTE